jgi:hypothetical protein
VEQKPPPLWRSVLLLVLAYWLAFGGEGSPFNPPGPRLVVIVRESEDDTPAFGRMVTNLRNGEPAKTLEVGKHQLDVLDDDSPTAAKWLPSLAGIQQPAVLVIAPPEKVLAKQSLPADATAATVLDILKANGG